jgi:lipopolysaccharide/colanic/teichoic acid biosynthesis glycosyltransferase
MPGLHATRSSRAPRPRLEGPQSRRAFHLVLAKRVLDIAAVLMFGVVALPLFLVLCLLIRLDSPGPAVYWCMRVGRGGIPFRCFKLRSMHHDAGDRLVAVVNTDRLRREYELYRKLRKDPRITRVGSVLRRLSLDELPQLWNVLVGDISLVGPRPYDVAELALMNGLERTIQSVPPGLTGLWQVSGRNTTSFAERLALDVAYVDTWSLSLDLKILVRTLPTVLSGRGAY